MKCTRCHGKVRKVYWSKLFRDIRKAANFYWECVKCEKPMKDCTCDLEESQ
jgi:hypothetical protein